MNSAKKEPSVDAARIQQARCPSCLGNEAESTLLLAASPIMVCSAFPSASEARAIPTGDIDLGTCTTCGFLYNMKFEQALALSGAQYESSQAASPHFTAFARALASEWVERYGLRGKHVIEVGCGQGEFLVELVKAGAASGTGIDPLFDDSFIPADLKGVITAVKQEFGEVHLGMPGAALVCRHALEHIGDVSGFLRLVESWAEIHPGAPLLFEVPGTERILAEAAFWDVFYEHCNYFTALTLEDAFLRVGLDVKRCELVYDGQYLLLEAVGSVTPRAQTPTADVNDALIRSRNFGDHVNRAVAACGEAMRALAEASRMPIVIWQGASKTVSLTSLLGADAPISFAVDLNARRHGQYLPPFGLEVKPPDALVHSKPKHVVLMNAVYMKEVRAELDRMGLMETELHSINSLLEV